MVSTRQMTTTTGPGGATEESFDTAASTSTNLARPLPAKSPIANIFLPPKQTIYFLDLPIELVEKIVSYTGYKNVTQLRTVSSKMNQICSGILNSTFQKLQNQTYNHFQTVKKTMPKRESARRVHPSASECDIVETCYMRLQLLEMTFGKHIDKKHCCFFPGAILDEIYNILYYIRTTPKLGRPYKITEELFDLSTMAMEYFKEKLEPTLPAIAYFSKDFLDFTPNNAIPNRKSSSHSNSMPSPPQSNMVLRKGIRKIKQGMKRYNNQLTVLRSDLRFCKRKSTEQVKQIAEMQKLLGEQQKQLLEYATRLDENDKKNEEMSMKISTLLQEANKCKTELQYWRSKSPAISNINGQLIANQLEDIQQLVNLQPTINLDENSFLLSDAEKHVVQTNDIIIDLTTTTPTLPQPQSPPPSTSSSALGVDNNQLLQPISNECKINIKCQEKSNLEMIVPDATTTTTVISCVGSPKSFAKRKILDIDQQQADTSSGTFKKARRVQNKGKCLRSK